MEVLWTVLCFIAYQQGILLGIRVKVTEAASNSSITHVSSDSMTEQSIVHSGQEVCDVFP